MKCPELDICGGQSEPSTVLTQQHFNHSTRNFISKMCLTGFVFGTRVKPYNSVVHIKTHSTLQWIFSIMKQNSCCQFTVGWHLPSTLLLLQSYHLCLKAKKKPVCIIFSFFFLKGEFIDNVFKSIAHIFTRTVMKMYWDDWPQMMKVIGRLRNVSTSIMWGGRWGGVGTLVCPSRSRAPALRMMNVMKTTCLDVCHGCQCFTDVSELSLP